MNRFNPVLEEKLNKIIDDMKKDGSYFDMQFLLEFQNVYYKELKNSCLTKELFLEKIGIPIENYFDFITGRKYSSLEERCRILYALGYETNFLIEKINEE